MIQNTMQGDKGKGAEEKSQLMTASPHLLCFHLFVYIEATCKILLEVQDALLKKSEA